MLCTDYELVARVGKTRGLEGEVTATTVDDLPFCIYEGLHVHVVPPSLYGKRELTVASVEEGSGNTYRMSFEEIDSIEEAQEVTGHFLLADVRDIDLETENPAVSDIGRNIVDERFGELGVVTEVIETAANDVWVTDGPYGEVLVPIIDDVIIDHPEDASLPISTRIMDGLIEQ